MSNYKINRKFLVDDVSFKVSIFWNRRFARYKRQLPIWPWYMWKSIERLKGCFHLLPANDDFWNETLHIFYSNKENWSHTTWKVQLLKEECNYGWTRWWFVCPITGKKCANLYLTDSLGSREWLQLKYASQLETSTYRTYKRFFEAVFSDDQNPIKYPYRNWKPTRKQTIRTQKLFEVSSNLAQKGILSFG